MVINFSNDNHYYNNMEIRENNMHYILAPLSKKIDARESNRIFKEIANEKREIALDLNYVEDCSIDFYDKLKTLAQKKKIGIYNIPSDIFVILNTMQLDKYVNLYVSKLDFEENTRRLINRNFALV